MAQMVGRIAQEFKEDSDVYGQEKAVQLQLFSYADTIEAWAYDISEIMLRRVAQADYSVWLRVGEKISAETKRKLRDVTVYPIFKQLQHEQVELIKSLPIDAAQKVHEWTQIGLSNGQRYSTIAKRIQNELGGITKSRAIVIARTETARTRSNFTEARARAIGSTHYRWHTVGDASVRSSHARLNGKIFSWDDPPITDYGKGGTPIRSHPGCIFNCRCWAEPLFNK